MLTLLETIAAIKALDTEPDVIRNACNKVVDPKARDLLPLNANAKAITVDICTRYQDLEEKGDLIIALCASLGTAAGLAVKPGKEVTLLSSLLDKVTSSYAHSITSRNHNPFDLLQQLMAEMKEE